MRQLRPYHSPMPLIHTIDLHYLGIPGAIAAYVLIGPPPRSEPILIETGPTSTLEHLAVGLAALNLKLPDIRHALVTHIHLDHAGAAGELARHGTQIYVHEFGAKHLIDPSRLIDSATRIYGDQMERLWGRITAVPTPQITPLRDGDVLRLGGLEINVIETPGHARHHHAFAIEDVCFTGDAAGITVPRGPSRAGESHDACDGRESQHARFIAVPTPPPEFDLEGWLASIDRLQRRNFSAIYPTHFGRCESPAAHFECLRILLNNNAHFVRAAIEQGRARDAILKSYIEWNRRQAHADGISDLDFARYVSTNLLTMNVDGMIRYWTK